MKHHALLLLGVALVAAVLFSSCSVFSVPSNSLRSLQDAVEKPTRSADPLGVEKPLQSTKTDGKPSIPGAAGGVDQAKQDLADARAKYAAGVEELARLKADIKVKEATARAAEEQATADRIVRDGWWVFFGGIIASIIGIICVAKEYGMGGWWVLIGGAAVSVFGLCMIWLGPHWVIVTRTTVAIAGLAVIVGASWAWQHRKQLKQEAKAKLSKL